MNEENQEPKDKNANDQKSDDSSRSPGVDKDSPGVNLDSPGMDRDAGSSGDASKNNTEESSEDSETK